MDQGPATSINPYLGTVVNTKPQAVYLLKGH